MADASAAAPAAVDNDSSASSAVARARAAVESMLERCKAIPAPTDKDASTFQCQGLASGVALREHQKVGVGWMVRAFQAGVGALLGDEMGVGKTPQAVALLAHVEASGASRGPFLVLSPLSVVDHWAAEFARFAPGLKVVKLVGEPSARAAVRDDVERYVLSLPHAQRADPPFDFHVVLTTYEMVHVEQAFLQRFRWRACVVDEAHRLKNPDSLLARTLRTAYSVQRTFLLTGTPVQNSMRELYSLLHHAAPAAFPLEEGAAFEAWFVASACASARSISSGASVPRAPHQRQHAADLAALLARPFLRRTKVDADLRLPPLSEIVLYTPLTALQRAYYRWVLTRNAEALGAAAARGLTNVLAQLRKCCNHPYLFPGAEPQPFQEGDHLWQVSGKLCVLERLLPRLRRNGHRVLLFCQSTAALDILQDYLSWRGHSYERLDGSVRGQERWSTISRFQDAETFVFLLSTRAGGVGLNLMAADTVVLYDSDWNPQMDLQAIARVHRFGQTRPVRVIRLVAADTVEEVILHRALRKLRLARDVLAAPDANDATDDTDGSSSAAPASPDSLLQVLKRGLGKIGIDDSHAQDGGDGTGSHPPPPKVTASEAARAALTDAEVDAVLQRLGDASSAAAATTAPAPAPKPAKGEGWAGAAAPAQSSVEEEEDEDEEPQTVTQDDLLQLTSTQGGLYRFGDTQYNAKGEPEAAAAAQTGAASAAASSGDDDEALRRLMRMGSQRKAKKQQKRVPLTAEEKEAREKRRIERAEERQKKRAERRAQAVDARRDRWAAAGYVSRSLCGPADLIKRVDSLPAAGLHAGLVPALRLLARQGGASDGAAAADSGSDSGSDSDSDGGDEESSEESSDEGPSDSHPSASGDEHSEDADTDRRARASARPRGRVHYVLGDASQPQRVPGGDGGRVATPKIIVHLVDPSGRWTDRGFFAALSRLSPEPAAAYAVASANGDLALGSAHLVQVSAPDSAAGTGPVFVALLVGIRPAKRATRTRVDPLLLQRALERTASTAAVMGASLHVARISPQLGSWYAFERTLKRLAPLLGVPTLVYYYRRQPAAQRAQQALAAVPASRVTPTPRTSRADDAGAAGKPRQRGQRGASSKPAAASAKAAPATNEKRFGADEAVSKGLLSSSELEAWLKRGQEVGLDAHFPKWRENLGFAAAQDRGEVEAALRSMHHALAQARQEGSAGEAEALRFFVEFLRLMVDRKVPGGPAAARTAPARQSQQAPEKKPPAPAPARGTVAAPSTVKRASPAPALAAVAGAASLPSQKPPAPAPARSLGAAPSAAKRARPTAAPGADSPATATSRTQTSQGTDPVGHSGAAPPPAKRARPAQAPAAAAVATSAPPKEKAPAPPAQDAGPAKRAPAKDDPPPQFTAAGVYVPTYLRK